MSKRKLYWRDLTPAGKVRRWSKACRVIGNLSEHEIERHFVMRDWAIKTDCGTVGCAAGHCALDPSIQKDGFYINFTSWGTFDHFTVNPSDYYGHYAFDNIFTKRNYLELKGKEGHEIVYGAMLDYLKDLKMEAKRKET